MKRYPGIVLCTLLLTGANSAMAQQKAQLPIYQETERSANLYDQSRNPVSLWFSPAGDLLDFHTEGDFRRGDLHNVDESSRINAFGIDLKGQKRFNKVICSGSISYDDGKEYARRWNSTLQVADDNPFILGDSIPSDFNIQRFNLKGTVAYSPLKRLILGMHLEYDTGSSANQTDPRPKTDGMHFIITPGIQYRMGQGFSLGLSGSFDLMSESISHAIIDPRESYVYFRFNGLGDYSTISTNTALSYPRDYTGTEYSGAIQLAWEGKKGIANLLEAFYASSTQKARDGGASFRFLGGDYSRSKFGVSDRMRLTNGRHTHNLTVGWEHKKIEGVWYEQTAYTDPDKNNQLSYKVQTSGLKNKEVVNILRAAYRFDKLHEGVPTFMLRAEGCYEKSQTDHYEEDGYNRRYSRFLADVEASKFFVFGANRITASLGMSAATPISSSQHVQSRIKEVYTDPQFEYITAQWIGANAAVRYYRLLGQLWVGLYAETVLKYYTGNGKYTQLLEGTDSRRFTLGIEILF